MTTIYVALEEGMLVVRGANGHWRGESTMDGTAPRSVAADPLHPERVWAGTVGAGAWRSEDAGASWQAAGEELADLDVSALAVAPDEEVVYAGIDPSALWRSEDGGRRRERLSALNDLPSAPTWSFPPRPDTSHVRWITLDPADPDRLYVCIEAGALVRSGDGGRTWTDRVDDAPYDTHTLAAHPAAPGRLYSAAGDGFGMAGRGYSESTDRGDTWTRPDDGIERHYLYGLAVDPGDPDTVVVSAANSPWEAHTLQTAASTIYRRTGGGPWHEALDGMPEPSGTLRPLLASNPAEPGVFYAATNHGIFRSPDRGETWTPLLSPLPASQRIQHAITVTP
jgi:hypothetical protein